MIATKWGRPIRAFAGDAARRALATVGLTVAFPPSSPGVLESGLSVGERFRQPIRVRMPRFQTLDEATADAQSVRWPLVNRILFRFAFAYLAFYNYAFFEPNSGSSVVTLHLARWIYGHPVSSAPNGSGDTPYLWAEALRNVLAAFTVTLIWSICDRKRPHYTRLYEWLRIGVRFALFQVMLSYGADKLVPNQFGRLTASRLTEPIGELSPMGMLWTFMAASPAYTIFGGLMEVVGALLLTTRRTTLLGALICAAVMTNVALMNFCYDVPVKLMSSQLLGMALFLTLPDIHRLWNVFVVNRSAPPTTLRPLFRKRWVNVAILILRTYIVVNLTQQEISNQLLEQHYNTMYAPPPLNGIWDVDTFERSQSARGSGAETPVIVPNDQRWQRMILGNNSARVDIGPEMHLRFFMQSDAKTQALTLKVRESGAPEFSFVFQRPTEQNLILNQTASGVHTHITLHRIDENSYLLLNRGFHWISDRPFNR